VGAFLLFATISLWGFLGFSSQWLTGTGVFNLPSSLNWPAGTVSGAAVAVNGNYFVPLVAIGRVQVYDQQLRFLHGWNLATGGKEFTVHTEPDGRIWIVDYRKQVRWFNGDGKELEKNQIEPPPEEDPDAAHAHGTTLQIPTAAPMLVFTSPILAWLVAAFGGLGMAMVRKLIQSGK